MVGGVEWSGEWSGVVEWWVEWSGVVGGVELSGGWSGVVRARTVPRAQVGVGSSNNVTCARV